MITVSVVHEASRRLSCYRYTFNQAPPSTSTMDQVPSTSTSSTTFETIFIATLKEYKKQTKTDIASHPLATQLQSCGSASAIIAVLRNQVQTFDQGTDERWTKWLDPTVNVLLAFSATLSNDFGMVIKAMLSPFESYLLMCVTIDIPSSERNFCWNWRPSSSEFLP